MNSRSPSPENDVFSLDIVPDREIKSASTVSTNFDGLLSHSLVLHEDLKDGCGGQLWPAGVNLAKYMLKYQIDLQGKSIIEIGAGGGLVGLAVANGCQMSDQQKLLITDQLPMLSLMQKNIELNHLERVVSASVYDWGSKPPPEVVSFIKENSQGPGQHPDIVLAADCVYFEPAFPLLLKTLTDLIGSNTVCYFCFKKRRKADMRFIRDMMKNFTVTDLDYEWIEESRREALYLYKVTLKQSKQ